MPEDNADLAKVDVEFERLVPDNSEGCPAPMTRLLSYLADEVPGGEDLGPEDLSFVRTARVEDHDYWLWRFREPGPDGDDAYLTVSRVRGQVAVGYEANFYRLTPEQYLLGDYHHAF